MFVEQLRRAVEASPRCELAKVSALLWKAYASGQVSEAEASDLSEAIELRKALPAAQKPAQRRFGSRPKTASIERRRRWAAAGAELSFHQSSDVMLYDAPTARLLESLRFIMMGRSKLSQDEGDKSTFDLIAIGTILGSSDKTIDELARTVKVGLWLNYTIIGIEATTYPRIALAEAERRARRSLPSINTDMLNPSLATFMEESRAKSKAQSDPQQPTKRKRSRRKT